MTTAFETRSLKHILAEMFFLLLVVAAVALYGQNTPVMSVFIAVNIIARFLLLGRKRDWIFFLIGLVGGGGNDVMSMARDVYRYTPPTMLPVPIPLWMLFMWGHIFVAFRQLFLMAPFQGPSLGEKPWKIDKRLILDLITFAMLRFIIYSFVHREPIPTLGYAGVIALRFIVLPPRAYEWKLLAAVISLGIAYEAAMIHFGLYIYYSPIFLGMPAWLLLYWVFMIPILVKGIFARIEMSLVNNNHGKTARRMNS